MGASFHLSYCRKLCQCTSVQRCFSSCHIIAFQRICILGGMFHSNWDFQLSSIGLMRSCYCCFKAFYLCHDEEEKKVPYLNPPSLSHVQDSICMSHSHVVISFCSSWCHRVVPLLLGVFLLPTALHILHRTDPFGSRLTSIIWKPNRFISVAETASKCCFYDTQHVSNWEGNLDRQGPETKPHTDTNTKAEYV